MNVDFFRMHANRPQRRRFFPELISMFPNACQPIATALFFFPVLMSRYVFRHDIHRECVASVVRVLTKQKADYAVVGREELDRQHISQVYADTLLFLSLLFPPGWRRFVVRQ